MFYTRIKMRAEYWQKSVKKWEGPREYITKTYEALPHPEGITNFQLAQMGYILVCAFSECFVQLFWRNQNTHVQTTNKFYYQFMRSWLYDVQFSNLTVFNAIQIFAGYWNA